MTRFLGTCQSQTDLLRRYLLSFYYQKVSRDGVPVAYLNFDSAKSSFCRQKTRHEGDKLVLVIFRALPPLCACVTVSRRGHRSLIFSEISSVRKTRPNSTGWKKKIAEEIRKICYYSNTCPLNNSKAINCLKDRIFSCEKEKGSSREA